MSAPATKSWPTALRPWPAKVLNTEGERQRNEQEEFGLTGTAGSQWRSSSWWSPAFVAPDPWHRAPLPSHPACPCRVWGEPPHEPERSVWIQQHRRSQQHAVPFLRKHYSPSNTRYKHTPRHRRMMNKCSSDIRAAMYILWMKSRSLLTLYERWIKALTCSPFKSKTQAHSTWILH